MTSTAPQLALPDVSTEPTREAPRRIRPALRKTIKLLPVRAPRQRPKSDLVDIVREVLESRDELGRDVHGGTLLGDAVVSLRTRLLLSQDQLIERAGIPRRHGRCIEAGGEATALDLIGIGTALDVSPIGLAALPPGRTVKSTRIASEALGRGQAALTGFPGSPSWDALPWRLDATARGFVQDRPDGASSEDIGEAMGRSTKWVERTLAEAVEKLRPVLEADWR